MPFANYESYKNIAGASTTVVKTGSGILSSIMVNKSVDATTVSIYDALSATNPIAIATLSGTVPILLNYNGVRFNTGLTVVTSGATDITVSFA